MKYKVLLLNYYGETVKKIDGKTPTLPEVGHLLFISDHNGQQTCKVSNIIHDPLNGFTYVEARYHSGDELYE